MFEQVLVGTRHRGHKACGLVEMRLDFPLVARDFILLASDLRFEFINALFGAAEAAADEEADCGRNQRCQRANQPPGLFGHLDFPFRSCGTGAREARLFRALNQRETAVYRSLFRASARQPTACKYIGIANSYSRFSRKPPSGCGPGRARACLRGSRSSAARSRGRQRARHRRGPLQRARRILPDCRFLDPT